MNSAPPMLQNAESPWSGLTRTACLLVLCLSAPACSRRRHSSAYEHLHHPQLTYQSVLSGMEYARSDRTNAADPLVYHVLKIDLSEEHLSVGTLRPARQSSKGAQFLSEMAADASTPARRVVAAINGDYFGNGVEGVWGVQIDNSRLLYSPLGRSAFLVDPSGQPLIDRPELKMQAQFGDDSRWHAILDMNRPADGEKPGLHLYANAGAFDSAPATVRAAVIDSDLPLVGGIVTGAITRVLSDRRPAAIPANGLLLAQCGTDAGSPSPEIFREGQSVRIRTELSPEAVEAVSGGPRIARNGRISIEYDQEGIGPAEQAYVKRHHPRSAAGISRDRRYVFLVVVEGRTGRSKGLDIRSLARLMIGVGAADAVMFDGGLTANMFCGDRYLTREGGSGRVTGNGLAVFAATNAPVVLSEIRIRLPNPPTRE